MLPNGNHQRLHNQSILAEKNPSYSNRRVNSGSTFHQQRGHTKTRSRLNFSLERPEKLKQIRLSFKCWHESKWITYWILRLSATSEFIFNKQVAYLATIAHLHSSRYFVLAIDFRNKKFKLVQDCTPILVICKIPKQIIKNNWAMLGIRSSMGYFITQEQLTQMRNG